MSNGWSRFGGVLGIAYCVGGFVLIFLGWNGAATYDRVAAQVPYLVSGGFGGLGLIVLGSALIVAQSRRRQPVAAAAAIPARASAAPLGASTTGGGDGGERGGEMVVAGPTSYHRPDCRIVQGQADVTEMTARAAAASGRTPCRVCFASS